MAEHAQPADVVICDLWADDVPAGALEAAARDVWAYWLDETKRPWAEQKAAWLETPPGDGLPVRLGAIASGECVGTASIVVCDLPHRPELTPWVASVLVRDAWRGRGIGAALVTAAGQVAARHGIDALYLFTPDAEAFYARLGWSVFDHEVARGYEVVVMRKALVPVAE